MLFGGQEVPIEKNCALGLCTDLGHSSVFSIRTSRPPNNIYLFAKVCYKYPFSAKNIIISEYLILS